MNKKMSLNILVDNNGIVFCNNIPEILKKYFTNMETTIETMNLLTNNGEFYNIRCEFMKDENNYIVGNKMLFIFEGSEMVINIQSPLKKETMILKDEFCNLRNLLFHAFIKSRNIKYILRSKPLKLYSIHYKFYNNTNLVLDMNIDYNTINVSEFNEYLWNEKMSLNNNFSFKNILKYNNIKNINIIEREDIYPEYNKVVGIKEFLLNKKEIKNFDRIVIEEAINNKVSNLDEIDDLMYQTGILSLSDIKEALENEKIN